MVRMQAVVSLSIRAIGSEAARAGLWIEFHSAPDPYVSVDVSPEVSGEREEAAATGAHITLMITPDDQAVRRV